MSGGWGTGRYMAVCPNGHGPQAGDACAECGAPVAAEPAAVPARVGGKHHAGAPRPVESPADTCPWCGNPSPSQFCAQCGFRVRGPFTRQAAAQPWPDTPQSDAPEPDAPEPDTPQP